MSMLCRLFNAVILVFSVAQGQNGVRYRLVNTSYGVIRGKVDYEPHIPVSKFNGIPYAKPPVGALRFKAPVEPETWNNTRDAFHIGNVCMQQSIPTFEYLFVNTTMDEDCLSLNIFVPELNNNTGLMPVIVSIHGGGYIFGYGAFNDGTEITQTGVIVVTINYRLDVFGFLSTEDSTMPGNYGMMDQVEALKWVQKNIVAFGGDPKRVTIMGESAGGSSVSLLTLSPLAKGLFQRAIMESGVSLAPWAVALPGYTVSHRMISRLIATSLDCSDLEDTSKMMSCLQGVDRQALLNESMSLTVALAATIATPRVEKVFNFLPDLPINLLTRGEFNHVDTMRGFNADEAELFIGAYLNNKTSVQQQADTVYSLWLNVMTDLDKENMLKVMKGSKLSNVPDTPPIIRHAIETAEDIAFVAPTMAEINIVSQKSPEMKHYLFEFNYRPSYSPHPVWVNATHGEEVAFVFGIDSAVNKFSNTNLTKDDITVSRQMVEMWTNFAKTGDPTATLAQGGAAWAPYSTSSPNYLFIDPISEQRMWSRLEVYDVYREVLRLLTGYVSPTDCILG